MKKFISVLLCLCALCAALAGCSTTKVDKSTPDSAKTQEENESVYEIEAPYGVVCFPTRFKDVVATKIDGNKLSFTSADGKVNIFDLLYDSEEGELLGSIYVDDEYYSVSVEPYDIDETSADNEIYLEAQEAVSVIVSNFKKDENFALNVDRSPEDRYVFEIKTDVVSLYYPEKYKDKVTVKTSSDLVEFSYGDIKLFDIAFSGEEGDILGYYKNNEIRIIPYDYEGDDDEVFEMQEAINVILKRLMKDKDFSLE